MMRAVGKLIWVELKLFAREPFAMVFTFAFPIVLLLVLIGVFGGDNPDDYGMAPSDYYVASYVATVIAAVGLIAVPVHVAAYRERGVLRRFRASSVPPAATFGSQGVVGLIIAIVGALLLVIVGRLVHGVALPESVGPAIVAFALATFAFVAIGLLLAALVPNVRTAQALGLLIFVPMWMLGGPGPPRSVLSGFMQQIHDVLPLKFAVHALQDPWIGVSQNTTDLIVLAAILVFATAAALQLFRVRT